MTQKGSLATLKPLFFGRLSRVVFGLAALAAVPLVGLEGWNAFTVGGLVLLGLSFLLGGLMGNPGCEITALPNLLLRSEKRVHFL